MIIAVYTTLHVGGTEGAGGKGAIYGLVVGC